MSVSVTLGDCVAVLQARALQVAAGGAEAFDGCVTDAPYHLVSISKRLGKPGSKPIVHGRDGAFARIGPGFMGKAWDGGDVAARAETWRAVYDNLKPGAWLVAFGGTRTFHRMACAIEDAGFEIRDSIFELVASDTHVERFLEALSDEQRLAFAQAVEESQFGGLLAWIYGSGFPKSVNVSKAIDKAASATREVIGVDAAKAAKQSAKRGTAAFGDFGGNSGAITAPATPEAEQWDGWGTALKPAIEPIVLARKPLEGTIVDNVLRHGTGGLNIDGCRIETEDSLGGGAEKRVAVDGKHEGWERPWMRDEEAVAAHAARISANVAKAEELGRFPANVILDGSEEVRASFPAAPGQKGAVTGDEPSAAFGGSVYNPMHRPAGAREPRGDSAQDGSAARFFYSAKADDLDRLGSEHPTVKPVDLMRWLVRLVCRPGGLILDPFAGSGSTGIAAIAEGMRAELIDIEPEHVADIERKLAIVRGEGRHRLAELNERKSERAARAAAEKGEAFDGPLFGASA